jgi:hypothetical protein
MSAKSIMKKARNYFEKEYGLKIKNHISGCCAEFHSTLGYVSIQIFNNGNENEVILTSQEFDSQVQAFANSLEFYE